MPQITLDAQSLAQIDLHNYLESQVQQIAPTCSGCKHFTQSSNFPLFGSCGFYGGNVAGCDRACGIAASIS